VTIWEYEKIRSKAITTLRNANPLHWMKRKQKQLESAQTELQVELNRIQSEIDVLWAKLTPGERVFFPICLINVIVFGLWRLPSMRPLMLKYFASNPAAKAVCWPMVLSTFSHYSMFHLFANMYVLHSFSAAAYNLGREQFLGLYLSAGVISSFASYLFKIATSTPGYSLGAVSSRREVKVLSSLINFSDSRVQSWPFSLTSATTTPRRSSQSSSSLVFNSTPELRFKSSWLSTLLD
jgi:rhomboid-like protein